MGVVTTRRIEDLRQECEAAGIEIDPNWTSRLQYMDALREHLGGYDAGMQLDPMKAYDLKKKIDWSERDPEKKYAGIAQFLNEDWVAEQKLDGVRQRLFLGLKGNTLNSGRRSVKTYAYTSKTDNFPQFRDAVVPANLVGTILDCELLAPSDKMQITGSKTVTDSLLNASVALVNCGPEKAVATQQKYGSAKLYVFDILAVVLEDGDILDLTDRPYWERRIRLESAIYSLREANPGLEIHLLPQLPATAETIEQSMRDGYEGVVLKKLDSPYLAGKRSQKAWCKVKTFSTADAFIVGYNAGENANTGMVGSLDLAVFEEVSAEEFSLCAAEVAQWPLYMKALVGDRIYLARPVAQVGNLLHDWRKEISNPDGSLKDEWYGKVIEWTAQGLGKNGRARHASMDRLRPDKTPMDCLADQLEIFPRV